MGLKSLPKIKIADEPRRKDAFGDRERLVLRSSQGPASSQRPAFADDAEMDKEVDADSSQEDQTQKYPPGMALGEVDAALGGKCTR
jgi:hypothetical protein